MTVVCEHPFSAVRWDRHRALLRCTACGRVLEEAPCECSCHQAIQPGLVHCPRCGEKENP